VDGITQAGGHLPGLVKRRLVVENQFPKILSMLLSCFQTGRVVEQREGVESLPKALHSMR
jgi:hypothetical protein